MNRGIWIAGLLPLLAAASGCIPRPATPPPAQPAPPPVATPLPDPGFERQDMGVVALPAPTPTWEARPVVADARIVAASRYTVATGDTLRSISAKTGAGSEAIARANGLTQPYVIRPGQTLAIPAGRYHRVKAGETGIAIARAYGVPWRDVLAANALEPPFILRVDQRILIPDASAVVLARPSPPTGAPAGPVPNPRQAAFELDIDSIVTGGEPAIGPAEKPAAATASSARILPPSAAVADTARFNGRFDWPVDSGSIVKRFGPGASGERLDGVKIGVPAGTPIHATADGVVAYTGTSVATLGGIIMVKHGSEWTSVYGHASRLSVQRGQAVKRGQIIGYTGSTGQADRPQLHFELRKGRDPVDPAKQLPPRK
jgi:murein DD-endopeptidase MepM/ murein hydrolase activator NlpD